MVKISLSREHIRWLFLIFAFTSFSVLFSYFIFPSQSSVLAITLLVIGLTPPLYSLMANEEAVVAESRKRTRFLDKYGNILQIMVVIIIGLYLSFLFWFVVLPSDRTYNGNRCSGSLPCREALFSPQLEYLKNRTLSGIIGLILLCFVLSVAFAAGAVLIIAWDASALVTASSASPAIFIAYMPQLLAFFLTSLAGALLSFAIIRHEWRSRGFFMVIRDSLGLLALSVCIAIASSFLF